MNCIPRKGGGLVTASDGGDRELPPGETLPWNESDRPNVEICSYRSGVGIVDNIRRDGNRMWFSFGRPGEHPEDLWLAPDHFDERLRNGDWARIKSVGEGPPEPDWNHSELWRMLPPRDEPPISAVHIEPTWAYGVGEVMVTVQLDDGQSFSRLKETDRYNRRGEWHLATAWPRGAYRPDREWSDADAPKVGYEVETLLELLYSAWRLAYTMVRNKPELFKS
jgi:hypothetical protein